MGEEADILREMIADRDKRIEKIKGKSQAQREREISLCAELEKLGLEVTKQQAEFTIEKDAAKQDLSAVRNKLESLQRDFRQQGISLRNYCQDSTSARKNDPSYVMRMQAQLCKAMHSLGITDHQMELVQKHSESLSKYQKDQVLRCTEEKTAAELKSMNELMAQDSVQRDIESVLKAKLDKIAEERSAIDRQLEENRDSDEDSDDESETHEEEDEEEKEAKEEMMKMLTERRSEIDKLVALEEQQEETIAELEEQLSELEMSEPLPVQTSAALPQIDEAKASPEAEESSTDDIAKGSEADGVEDDDTSNLLSASVKVSTDNAPDSKNSNSQDFVPAIVSKDDDASNLESEPIGDTAKDKSSDSKNTLSPEDTDTANSSNDEDAAKPQSEPVADSKGMSPDDVESANTP